SQFMLIFCKRWHQTGHIGHIQAADTAINHPESNQEQCRCQQVDGDVVNSQLETCLALSMQQQYIRRHQQNFKEHEQVKQIACQECTSQTHQQEMHHGMEVTAA